MQFRERAILDVTQYSLLGNLISVFAYTFLLFASRGLKKLQRFPLIVVVLLILLLYVRIIALNTNLVDESNFLFSIKLIYLCLTPMLIVPIVTFTGQSRENLGIRHAKQRDSNTILLFTGLVLWAISLYFLGITTGIDFSFDYKSHIDWLNIVVGPLIEESGYLLLTYSLISSRSEFIRKYYYLVIFSFSFAIHYWLVLYDLNAYFSIVIFSLHAIKTTVFYTYKPEWFPLYCVLHIISNAA